MRVCRRINNIEARLKNEKLCRLSGAARFCFATSGLRHWLNYAAPAGAFAYNANSENGAPTLQNSSLENV
jgi:hypothetical protein